ncbi:MAG: radical SAM protein [Magnetococcales bacterium]|nr:radical SAM protein [Magnetococcales bacterium]
MKENRSIRHFNRPLFFHSLVVECTDRCNAACDICYQSSSPKGASFSGSATDLAIEVIERALREGMEIQQLHKRFHLAGGEAFLDVDRCVRLFEHARKCGYHSLTSTTNGFWAKNKARGLAVAKRVRKAGLNSIELSTDHWHLPYVSAATIDNCIAICRETGISVNLRTLATLDHTHHEILSRLAPESIDHVTRITCGPVFSVGRARDVLPLDRFVRRGGEGSCYSVLNLAINPAGDVFPCCAGLDHTDGMLFGNVHHKPLEEIVRGMDQSKILRTLVFFGARHFIPILHDAGLEIPAIETYGNSCDLCVTIFSNPRHVAAIREYHARLDHRALAAATAHLESRLSAECAFISPHA